MTNNLNLVELINNQLVTTSIKVAGVFNKQRQHIMRSLENVECSNEFRSVHFWTDVYLDNYGREQKLYKMDKDGFTFLAMGFTGKKAAQFKEAYINAFNQMEQTLKQQKPDMAINANTGKNPKILQTDKDGFYSIILYFSKLRYVFENEEILFLLDDINYFLEVTRLNGVDKERTENNYTIHHILCDYNIIPRLKIINDNHYLFLRLPQLIEFCDRYKTKRSSMLQEALEYKLVKYVSKHFKNEIEDRKLLMITA